MNKYLFQIVIDNGEYATEIKVSAEDRDEAKLEAEIKARRICSKKCLGVPKG